MLLQRCALFLSLIASLHAAEADHHPQQHLPGQPLALESLPDSPLRRQIAAMPAPARQRALERLTTLHFCDHDLELMFASADGSAIGISCPKQQPTGAAIPATIPAAAGLPQAAPVPIATPPVLNSRPGATASIYLDFNGGIVSGTQWNSDEGIASWDCRPFDTDADETTFSDAEQLDIQRIWERVAEDFAPWDVNVTTVLPSSGTWSRAMITRDTDATAQLLPSSGSAAGIAYVDVFGSSLYAPAFVYFNAVSSAEDWIAEVISHEIGHNLGLTHDGTLVPADEYYGGHGTGLTSWGPLMGTGYNRNLSQWSRGEYSSASNTAQDDLAQITSYLPVRVDDHGGSIGTATTLVEVAGAVSSTGVIATTTDMDALAFSCGAGPVSFTVTTYRCAVDTSGGNLDVRLDLYTAANVLVATANVTGDPDSILSTTVAAGDYVLIVSNDSEPTVPATGYTTYGSLGQWTMTGTITPPDPFVSVAVTDGPAREVGPDPGTFTISLSWAPLAAVTIPYVLTGTATAPADYAPVSGSVTITPPATSATVDITPVTDSLNEYRESVILTIQTGTGYRMGSPLTATMQIADPDVVVDNQDDCALGSGFALLLLMLGLLFGMHRFRGITGQR